MATDGPAVTKPSYRVPSMEEVRKIPWNGYNVISTFSGCGGSSLGYQMAGFRTLWASEFVPAAQEVYKKNHPHSILDTQDIRNVSGSDILSTIGLQKGELDVLDGSPPCASFSTSGNRHKDWGEVKKYSDVKQRTDDLFFEYARILKELQPKVFVAENVSGLVKGVTKGYFLEVLKTLKTCGYRVRCRKLDAQWLGVPQQRQRVIFIGVRQDLECEPVHPKPFPYRYTVRDAFNGQDEIEGEYESKNNKRLKRLWKWLKDNNECNFTKATKVLEGRETLFNWQRSKYNAPCPCVIQTDQTIFHPKYPRTLSIPELKRICAFPDDFILSGSFSQKWERLARAVPPLMMKQIAKTIQTEILDHNADS